MRKGRQFANFLLCGCVGVARGLFVRHYTIYFILWHDFSYRARRQLMLSTSKVGQRTDGRGERGEKRARQSIVTDIPQQQQLRHRHRHGHRHRHRHRHRSVIVVSCFVFVFVSKTKAARKCSTRIVAWLPQCEVCLIMHISTSSSSPLPQRPNHAQFCPLTPPGLGPSLLGLHINKFRGMGEYVSVCE